MCAVLRVFHCVNAYMCVNQYESVNESTNQSMNALILCRDYAYLKNEVDKVHVPAFTPTVDASIKVCFYKWLLFDWSKSLCCCRLTMRLRTRHASDKPSPRWMYVLCVLGCTLCILSLPLCPSIHSPIHSPIRLAIDSHLTLRHLTPHTAGQHDTLSNGTVGCRTSNASRRIHCAGRGV